MKNIQVIDGAINSTFEVYEIPDELFLEIFPDGKDIAFLDDLVSARGDEIDDNFWNAVYKVRVDKKRANGIHGTLHLTGSPCEKKYYPTRKENEVSKQI